MKFPLRSFAFAMLAGLALSQAASATVILGNLPQTNDNFGTFMPFSSPPTIKAISFTMDPGADYTLDNVVLRLQNFTSGLATPIVQIRNDVGTSDPGSTVLMTFTNPTPQGAGTFSYTFTPTGSLTLAAETKYWLYVTSTSGASFNWRASSSNATPTGVATLNNLRLSDRGLAFANSSTINSFQINGTEAVTAVPEPSTLALSALGVSVGALAMRRRSRIA